MADRNVTRFTYTPGEDTDLARIRLTIDDIHEDDKLFDDAELELMQTIEGSWPGGAARAAESLASRFARDFDFGSDDTSVQKIARAKQYAALAARLRSQIASATGTGAGFGTVRTLRQDGYQANRGVDHHDVATTLPS